MGLLGQLYSVHSWAKLGYLDYTVRCHGYGIYDNDIRPRLMVVVI